MPSVFSINSNLYSPQTGIAKDIQITVKTLLTEVKSRNHVSYIKCLQH